MGEIYYVAAPKNLSMTDLLILLIVVCFGTAMLCFIVSSITRNYSQVDKLWSIMPIIYTWIIAFKSGFEPRLILMAALVTIWGIRLSFNFWRRGGYSIKIWSGEEDYRWAVLRSKPVFQAHWVWVLFNLLFISIYQMVLVLLITLPALLSLGGKPLFWGDALLAGLMLLLIVIETVADQQQWNFHSSKGTKKGFTNKGLWAIVRHPNYASEQAIWIVFYFFSVAATGEWLNMSAAGAVLLVLLFKGSSDFSESISMGKYPGYADYQRRVPRFIPFSKYPGDRNP